MTNRFAISWVLTFLLSVACAEEIDSSGTTSSSATHPPIDEIVSLAEKKLSDIGNDYEWIVGATEVAIAFGVTGQPDRANALLDEAGSRAQQISGSTQQVNALLLIAPAMLNVDSGANVKSILELTQSIAQSMDDDTKRWDLMGKLAVAHAFAGEYQMAMQVATSMPEGTETLASYKARTLHDIAPLQAQQEDKRGALATLTVIDFGLAYYQAASRADVAISLTEQGYLDDAMQLLQEADKIAREQTDGYFVAGALRHIAVAHAEIGQEKEAEKYFSHALSGARGAETPQHQARAISRIATSMSDVGFLSMATAALPEAVEIATNEEREAFRMWSYYEIAGSAAFSGDFETASSVLENIPQSFTFSAGSLKSAAERDVAWGLARHGRINAAVELAMNIQSPRESAQSLSRIVQVITDPAMKSLPRYL